MSRKIVFVLLLLAAATAGCNKKKKGLSAEQWRPTLESRDKNPYGAWLAHESLKFFFPNAKQETLPGQFRYTSIDDAMRYNESGRSLLVAQGLDFYISNDEWTALKDFVERGNELVIFSSHLDNKIETELKLYKQKCGGEDYLFNQFTVTDKDLKPLQLANDTTKYGYTGRPIRSYFEINADTVFYYASVLQYENTETDSAVADSAVYTIEGEDTSITYYKRNPPVPAGADQYYDVEAEKLMYRLKADTLGYVKNNVNFVRYKLGDGHITLHAAPLTISNYFLLQSPNEKYLSGIWQTLPGDIAHVYWCDYFKHSDETTDSNVLWRYPATRYAIILGLLAILIYVLFEGKRKQRIIPVIPMLKNDSVSFIETVGRLYYNKGNHKNLAEKMTMQFLEWVRTHYFLNTNLLNEQFIAQLTIKSGQPEAKVRMLLDMIHEIKLGSAHTDDAYLYQLYTTIQQFYKNIY